MQIPADSSLPRYSRSFIGKGILFETTMHIGVPVPMLPDTCPLKGTSEMKGAFHIHGGDFCPQGGGQQGHDFICQGQALSALEHNAGWGSEVPANASLDFQGIAEAQGQAVRVPEGPCGFLEKVHNAVGIKIQIGQGGGESVA